MTPFLMQFPKQHDNQHAATSLLGQNVGTFQRCGNLNPTLHFQQTLL
jgi:hypothetical protein